MRRSRWIVHLAVSSLLVPFASASPRSQEPTTQAPASGSQPSTATSSSKPGSKKYSHANDFLIRGTVFNEKALAFPGVQLRIRRAGEKKFRWETYTNSRGEFAVRVPQGSEYEMVVHTKGFADQIQNVDAKNGANEESKVFRMEPATGEKK
jgi:hypothetical protein